MKLLSIVMKSGVKIDLKNAEKIEVISREEVSLTYRGIVVREETKWTPSPEKNVATFLRVTREGSVWEVRESEIAVFEYARETEQIQGGNKEITI